MRSSTLSMTTSWTSSRRNVSMWSSRNGSEGSGATKECSYPSSTRSHYGSAPISRPASRSPSDPAIHRHTGDDDGTAERARSAHARHGRTRQSKNHPGSPERDMDELGHRPAGRRLGGARRAGGLG